MIPGGFPAHVVVVCPGVKSRSPTQPRCEQMHTALGEVPRGLNLLVRFFTRMCNSVAVTEEHTD